MYSPRLRCLVAPAYLQSGTTTIECEATCLGDDFFNSMEEIAAASGQVLGEHRSQNIRGLEKHRVKWLPVGERQKKDPLLKKAGRIGMGGKFVYSLAFPPAFEMSKAPHSVVGKNKYWIISCMRGFPILENRSEWILDRIRE